jgi:diguanylate cyclase (GGDEF)-like protein/PAS domain S-box-containing protein
MLGRAPHIAAAALRAPIAFLLVLEEDAACVHGNVGITDDAAHAVALGAGLTRQATATVLLDDNLSDPESPVRAAAATVGAVAMLAVPLPAADVTAGWLCVLDDAPRRWDADDEALLGELAAAGAVELTLRRELAARRSEEEGLRLLHLLSEGIAHTHDLHSALLVLLGHVAQITGWDHGEAWVPNADGTRLVHSPSWFSLRSGSESFAATSSGMSFAPGEGLPGVVWLTGQPVWMGDLSQFQPYRRAQAASDAGFRAAVAIPVLARNTVAAVLVFHSRTLGIEDHQLTRLVATAAAQLGPILQRKTAEDALRRSEAMLAGILHFTPDAIVSVDAAQRIRIFNAGAERTFGYAAAEVLGQSLDMLLPGAARGRHGAHVEEFMASEQPARWMNERGQIAGRRKDGETFPAEATISKLGAGDDCVCTVVLRDVSERRRAERELSEARRQLESILSAAGEGIVGLDTEGRATFVNRAAADLLGYDAEELIGRALHELVHHTRADGTSYPSSDCPSLGVLRTGAARTVDTDVFWRKDGTPLPVQYTSTPIQDDGAVRGIVLTFADFTRRRAIEEALRTLATRDELTGLHNRRGFMALAEQQLALAHRSGEGCLLFYFDLNDFKRINDTSGHQVGDEALVEVAQVLRDTFRQSDIVARLGGDEFVGLAVRGSRETVDAIHERLRRRLAVANAHVPRRYTLSLSVGVAHFVPGDERSLEGLVRDADAALYEQKRLRRARVGSERSEVPVGP